MTVHQAYHNPVEGAHVEVAATMDTLSSGVLVAYLSCTTGPDGRCPIATLDSGYKIDKKARDMTLDVVNVEHGTFYHSEENHDEEGDSNGTTMVLARPE